MVFNLQGSEIIIILLLALVVLGPEKLPDAVRKFNQTFGELKKMGSGFQSELKSALDEPMREMRNTTDIIRDAADPSKYVDTTSPSSPGATSTPPAEAAGLPLTADASDAPDTPDAGAVPDGSEPVDGPDGAQTSGPDSGDATAGHDVAAADPSDPGSETVATAGDPPAAPSPGVDGPGDDGPGDDGPGDDGPGDDGDEVEATGETATA